MRTILFATLITLSGCALTRPASERAVEPAEPPTSELTVSGPLNLAGSTLAVVIRTDSLTIDDQRDVRLRLGRGLIRVGGRGGDPQQLMRTFLGDQFPRALMDEVPFESVVVVESLEGSTSSLSPAQIAETAGADFVLFMDALHQYRAVYIPEGDFHEGVPPMMVPTGAPGGGMIMMGGSDGGPDAKLTVRQDVDYRLWDARAGTEVASGRVESEKDIADDPTRRHYVRSVEEMAKALALELGIR